MKTIKICHIGCGGMSLRGHGPALKKYEVEYPNTELVGCCDLDAKKVNIFADLYGFRAAYTDWEKMLDEIIPDAVSLVIPVQYTAQMAVSILKKGFNLLTEKPPGMNPGQCMAIILAAGENNLKAAAAFNRRHMPMVKKLKDKLGAKPIKHIKYDFFRSGRKDADFSTTSIHGIDTVKMIAGCDYKKVNVTYQKLESTPIGNIFLSGMMESTATVSLNFYPDSGFTAERATVICENEVFFLNIPVWGCFDHPGSLIHFKNNELVERIDGQDVDQFILNGFYDEHRDFYEAVRNGLPVPHEISDSLQSVEIMELIRNSKSSYRK